MSIVLSLYQIRPLLHAQRTGASTMEISPDLGRTQVEVRIEGSGARFPTGELLRWEDARKIAEADSRCFRVDDNNSVGAIQVYSEKTGLICSLYPTAGAPSMLLSGFIMHRIKDIDPWQDTLKKVTTIQPLVGRVLDTATGLGYTAIEAARTASEVVTIEFDPGAQAILRENPWSQPLLTNPKVQQLLGDAYELVPELENNSFDRIIHDPPAFSRAGQLYSGEFYRQLFRVLKPRGRLFHYIGDLNSKSGSAITKGSLKRLQEAGFSRIIRRPEAFGVVAYK